MKFFSVLLNRCAERDLIAICRLIERKNSKPRLVALLPQKEEIKAKTNEQISPPGFHVVYLPFAEDIRDLSKMLKQNRPKGQSGFGTFIFIGFD